MKLASRDCIKVTVHIIHQFSECLSDAWVSPIYQCNQAIVYSAQCLCHVVVQIMSLAVWHKVVHMHASSLQVDAGGGSGACPHSACGPLLSA